MWGKKKEKHSDVPLVFTPRLMKLCGWFLSFSKKGFGFM